MLIKTTGKYWYTPIRRVKVKNTEIRKVGKNVEQFNLLNTAGGNQNGRKMLQNSLTVSYKFKYSYYRTDQFHSCLFTQERLKHVSTQTSTEVFLAVL